MCREKCCTLYARISTLLAAKPNGLASDIKDSNTSDGIGVTAASPWQFCLCCWPDRMCPTISYKDYLVTQTGWGCNSRPENGLTK